MCRQLQRARQNKPLHLFPIGQRLVLLFLYACLALHVQAQPVQRHQLANGLELGYVQDTTRRLCHLGLTLRGGASLNPPGKAGWANFFEHHFWGSADSSGYPIGSAFAGDGLVATAGTYLEHHTFTLSMAPERLRPGLAVLAAALGDVLARPPQRLRILTELANGLQAAEEAPFYFLLEGVRERMWADAAPRNALGSYAPLLNFDQSALQAWMSAYLHPGNCLLTATGPGPAEPFFQAADSLLATWRPESAGAGIPKLPASSLKQSDYFVVENEFAQRPLLALAWPLPGGRTDVERTRLAQAFVAIARLQAGPFHQAITAPGRADAIWWEYLPTLNPGYLILRIAPHPDSVPQCLQAVQDQLHAMTQPDWKGARLLETAARMQTLERGLAWDRSSTRLDLIGSRWARMEQDWAGDSLPEAVSVPALRQFVADFLAGKPHIAGLLADSRLSQALAGQFRPVGPTIAAAPAPKEPIDPHADPALPDSAELAAELAAAVQQREFAYLHNIRIYFIGNTLTLDSSTTSQLSDVAFVLRKYPDLKLYLNGYADGVGDGYVNYKLSIQRARAVQTELIRRYQIPEERLILQPFGEAFAEYPDDTPEHRRKNRRVTFEEAPADAQPRYFID